MNNVVDNLVQRFYCVFKKNPYVVDFPKKEKFLMKLSLIKIS